MGTIRVGDRVLYRAGATVLAAIALHALVAVADPGPSHSYWLRCPESSVVVHAEDRLDANDACRGAKRAIEFFRSLALRNDAPITVEVLRGLLGVVSPTAAGAYLKSERRVLLQTYQNFKLNGTWFEVPIDRRLYQSAAAHEIAHARAHDNFHSPKPPIDAMEYIAYVTQFATMEDSQRRKALAAIPGDGFSDVAEMSEVIYMLAPMWFGAESYRHYMNSGNGAAFFRAVLSGVVLGD